MSDTIKVADYLFTRLRQLGVESVHGVPGDYNLNLLDYVEPAGLHWVGNANELNAGYATDGYARIKGIGALITTFGVGELSASNAIAGAYTERAAVVHIVGTPPRSSQDSRLLIHHTFNDGEYRRFGQIHALLTVAQTSLRDPRAIPQQIDEVLRQCLLHSRPVYIEVPVDLVDAPVLKSSLSSEIKVPLDVTSPSHDTALSKAVEWIQGAKQPAILIDGETRALGIGAEVQRLVELTKWPTWTTSFGKGLVDETLPNVHGVYRGAFGDSKVKEFFDNATLVLCFGPHYSSTNSYNYTSVPKTEKTIAFTPTGIMFGNEFMRDIPPRHFLPRLLEKLDASSLHSYDPYPDLPRDKTLAFSEVSSSDAITHDKLWNLFANYLRPGDILFGETGTAAYGCRDMPLPPHTKMFLPATWLSIGYMLPAAQGAALAKRELMKASKYPGGGQNPRTILVIGDGSFQMTVQELSTIIREDLDVMIVLINNDGYTIERCIHGVKQRYNDVAPWRYLRAPELFGAKEDTVTASARTWGELQKALDDEKLTKGSGLRMVEIFMDRNDAPAGPLQYMLKKQTENQAS